MASGAFNEFVRSFLGPDSDPREGLNETALLSLRGDERENAERLLLENLRDVRSVEGLGLLGSEKAADALSRLAEVGSFLVEVAVALWRIERNPKAISYLAGVLRSCNTEDRVAAVVALRHVNATESVGELVTCVEDPDSRVRYNAAKSLLRMHGFDWQPYLPHPISTKLLSNDPSARSTAIEELKRLILPQA